MARSKAWGTGLLVGAGLLAAVALWPQGVGTSSAAQRNALVLGEGGDSSIDRNPANLLPGFRARLERVFLRMQAQGFRPILWEGRRSQARAAMLARRGTGIVHSMHVPGAAADVLDHDLHWNAPQAFWKALGAAAKAEGLVWGGDFKRGDVDHLQAVRTRDEARFWAMTPHEQTAFVA